MINDRFTIWRFKDAPNAYVQKKLLNMERKLRLSMGDSLNDDMPNSLQFNAAPDYPNDLLMLDYFGNTQSVIPISAELKVFLERKNIDNLDLGYQPQSHYLDRLPVSVADDKLFARLDRCHFDTVSTKIIVPS